MYGLWGDGIAGGEKAAWKQGDSVVLLVFRLPYGLSDGALDLMRLALVRSTKGSLKRAKQHFGFATLLRYAGCLSILRSEPFPPARHLP